MDTDSSDGEQDLPMGAGAPVAMETGVGLKPQMDNIFSEIEKSLPTIDFDLSDVSSDTDEPVIFHRSLKMSELDYDDEKDLDTSLSGDSALDFFKSPPGMIHIPSVDKNNASSVSTSPTLTFDNDLAALLAAQEGFDEGEDTAFSWKDLERMAHQDKLKQEKKDSSSDPPTSNTLTPPPVKETNIESTPSVPQSSDTDNRQIGIMDAGNLVLAQLTENNRSGSSSVSGGRTVDLDIVVNWTTRSYGTSTSTDTGSDHDSQENRSGLSSHSKSSVSVSGKTKEGDVSEMDSNKMLERKRKERDTREQKRQVDREEQRQREKDLALMYMSAKAPHLSTQVLDAIDLDSSLDSENELAQWSPPPPLRTQLPRRSASHAAPSSSSSSLQNEHDGKVPSESDSLTMIQKLAKFSMRQAGRDYNPTAIDPQTGANMGIPTLPELATASSRPTDKPAGVKNSSSGTSAEGAIVSGTAAAMSDEQKEQQKATDAKTPTSSDKLAALIETLNKRKPKRETIYLDLRGFEQHQKEEQQRMASVSRVLGLEQQKASKKEESSDSEDEDKWMQQRQQIKRSFTSRTASAPSFKQQRLRQTQPARVINLQNKLPNTTSSRGVSTASCGVSAELSATGDAGNELKDSDSNRLREEEQAALLAREKEKERQKELARLAREAKEKTHSARLRMGNHLQSLRSTAAVSETKPCAENTPVLFDLEASYEPRPAVLPTLLDREEVLLVTVNLSSNGEIVLHNSPSSKTSTENVINALPKSYLSLICWLASLIPPDFSKVKHWLECPEEGAINYHEDFPPFHVIGMQQLLVDNNECLAIAVCPSPIYMLRKDDRRDDRYLKKGKKGDDTSRFYKFVDTYISRHSLATVAAWPRYLGDGAVEEEDEEEAAEYDTPLTFCNPYSPFLGKPMSAYMQIHKEPGAVDKIFNTDVSFFWQTVDSQENIYQHGWREVWEENTPQNTLFLLSSQALFRPHVIHETLYRVVSQSLDICGLRVLYPSSEKTAAAKNFSSSTQNAVASPGLDTEGVTPVLAVAVRGPHARIRLTSIVGPMDYALAKRTDPSSLTAIFGSAKAGLQIFCPRNVDRANSELVRWFGGRAPEQGSMDVGLPYRLKDCDYGVAGGAAHGGGRGKRGKKGGGGGDLSLEPKPSRPPAALTATTLSHIVLVMSPIVPVWVLGFLVSLMQQKAAFQPRGVRRLCLSVKKANTLGIPSGVHSLFCPGVNLEVADIDSGKQQQESCSPCTVMILERENASHHAASLTRILASELRSENILEWMEDRTISRFDLLHLFHTADYTDTLLTSLGGDFSKCPNFDPMCDVRGPLRPLNSSKELEQVVVLILLGRDLIKDWGSFLGKLQTFSTTNSQLRDFELLAVKWLSGMNSFQTREVTPYEIGDSRWRGSVHFLANEPAAIFAFRGVNAFKKLEPFVSLPVSTSTSSIPSSGSASRLPSRDTPHPTRLMSRTPKESYIFLRLFFSAHELYPDPHSRTLLPCLPESKIYYDMLEWSELGNVEGSKPRILLKSIEEQNLTLENIPELLLCGAVPLTTFLLIKPRAARKHLPKILRRVLHEGFSVVGLRLDLMDRELAQRFLALEFEDAVQVHDLHLEYLTSEPSIYLAVCRENAVKKLRDVIGPEDPQQARRQSQFYWRGIYGADIVHNGLYTSRTYIESVWDQKTFFPDGLCCHPTYDLDMEQIQCPAVDSVVDVNFSKSRHAVRSENSRTEKPGAPHITATEQKVHTLLMQTTCLVLPPVLMASKDGGKDAPFLDILSLLLSRGFELVGARMVWMSQQQAEQFLHITNSGSFEAVAQLTTGPCLVLAMERDNAVLVFDNTLGSSVEAQTVLSQYSKDLHRPADLKQAQQLLALFFDRLMPGSQMEIKPVPAEQALTASSPLVTSQQ